MLKQGQVVALDTTQNLLARFSGHTLNLRLQPGAVLPASLIARATAVNGGWSVRIAGFEEIEPVLAGLREGGCVLEDFQLAQTDLEDVFVRLMQGTTS